MTKFNKFLEEDREENRTIRNKKSVNRDTYSSLKIKVDTLNYLRKIKLVTGENSYTDLISKMIEVYINELPIEDKNNIDMLR